MIYPTVHCRLCCIVSSTFVYEWWSIPPHKESISPYLDYDLSHLALQILMHNVTIINNDLSHLIKNLSHLAFQILMHNATIINDELSHLINNLSSLALQIWLCSLDICCADLSHLMNNLSHLALHIMLNSEWNSLFIMIYPTLHCRFDYPTLQMIYPTLHCRFWCIVQLQFTVIYPTLKDLSPLALYNETMTRMTVRPHLGWSW